MNLEVVQISKVEKQTEKGIADVYKAVLKGFEYPRSENGDPVCVIAKLQLECEGDATALSYYIKTVVGDQRSMILVPVNRTLEEFQKEPG